MNSFAFKFPIQTIGTRRLHCTQLWIKRSKTNCSSLSPLPFPIHRSTTSLHLCALSFACVCVAVVVDYVGTTPHCWRMANNSAGEQSRADIKMIQINVHVDGLGSASCRVVVVRPAGSCSFGRSSKRSRFALNGQHDTSTLKTILTSLTWMLNANRRLRNDQPGHFFYWQF